MIFNWSLAFHLTAYRPALLRCLLIILFMVKIGEREILHFTYAIDTKSTTYKRMGIRIFSWGFSVQSYEHPGSRIFEFEPIGFSRAKRIRLVRESIYPIPA